MNEEGRFLNPYNFISFPENRSEHYDDTDVHTGVITYTITTRSPLFIPNTSSEHAFALETPEEVDHKSYDFYSYTELKEGRDYRDVFETPVIPGSELRGMVRGIYETLTGSCMVVLNTEMLPVKRTAEVFKAALLHKEAGKEGRLGIVEAEDCIYRESKDFRDKIFLRTDKQEGQKVFFRRPGKRKGKPTYISDCSGKKDLAHPDFGYLIKGMMGPKTGNLEKDKHNCHIFIPNEDSESEKKFGELGQDAIDRLKQVLISYREQPAAAEDCYKEYQRNLDKFLKQEEEGYYPVYYSLIERHGEKLLYLSPASITKEISHHSIGELAGAFKPCESRIRRCPACDLFGMTGESNEESLGSGIRFADAYVAQERENREYYDDIVTLEALGGPKLSNTEFYLERVTGADFWTYDYYTKEGYTYPYHAKLRGRKYYWHQPGKKLPKGIERTELNKSVRPVKSGVTFEGKLYFNRISERQLNQLLWILNGGNEEEQPVRGPIAFKLGGGKPLGFGSVELKVQNVTERYLSRENESVRYRNEVQTARRVPRYEEAGFLPECREDFMTICSLHAADGRNVTYPITADQHGQPMTEGFKWFVSNHVGYDYKKSRKTGMPNARIQMQTLCALPKIQGVETLPEQISQSGRPQMWNRGAGDRYGRAGGQKNYLGRTDNWKGKQNNRSEGLRKGESAQNKQIIGEVEGYNEKKTTVLIKCEDGKTRKVYFRDISFTQAKGGNVDLVLPLGVKVEIEYGGKQPNGYEQWKCIRIVK